MVTEATFFMLAGAKFGFRTSIKCIKWGLGRFYHFFYHFTIFGSHSVIWVIGSLLIVTETTFFILAGAKSGFRTSI